MIDKLKNFNVVDVSFKKSKFNGTKFVIFKMMKEFLKLFWNCTEYFGAIAKVMTSVLYEDETCC